MIMRIQELRERQGMTQSVLGQKMGVAQNAVSQWENEVALPKTRQLPLLAQVLECGIGDLFQAEPEEAC